MNRRGGLEGGSITGNCDYDLVHTEPVMGTIFLLVELCARNDDPNSFLFLGIAVEIMR